MRGHFSTPPALVECILDACGYTPSSDLSHLRIFDPACGSGNFLAGVARRLIASQRHIGVDNRQLPASVQRNLWGLDPDPVACFLAEMQLRTVLFKNEIDSGKQPFHIHQADGLVLPWEQSASVDLFLANPPYLAAKNNDLSSYRSLRGSGQVDSYLLFLRLALQVVRPNGWIGLVLPDPVLARANATQERQRLLEETTIHHLWHLSGVFEAYVGAVVIIAQKCPPLRMHQVTWVREKWGIDKRVYFKGHGRPQGSPPHIIASPAPAVTRAVGDAEGIARAVPPSSWPYMQRVAQALLRSQPGAELRYLLGDERQTLVERLHSYLSSNSIDKLDRFAPLSFFVSIRRGEELGKTHILLAELPPADVHGWYPVLRGGVDVHPYELPNGNHWIAGEAVVKRLERYLAPKLLVVKSTGNLQATLDLRGHVVLQTLYLLNVYKPGQESSRSSLRGTSPLATVPPSRSDEAVYSGERTCPSQASLADQELDQLYFLLALLNSHLLRRYVYVLHTAYKWVQPQMEQHVLARLPVPLVDADKREEIVERAKDMVLACSKVPSVVELKEQKRGEELERAICALYEDAIRMR